MEIGSEKVIADEAIIRAAASQEKRRKVTAFRAQEGDFRGLLEIILSRKKAMPYPISLEKLNSRTGDNLPGWFGLKVVDVAEGRLAMELVIKPQLLAPNGYLHAASVIAVADTAAGYATIAHLPDGATSFTTIELKSNFLGTAIDGTLR